MINHLNLINSTEHTLGFYWVLISLSVESVILLSTFCESWRNNHLFCHFTLLFLILQLSPVSITVNRCYRHTWMTIQHCKINNTCRFANVDTLLDGILVGDFIPFLSTVCLSSALFQLSWRQKPTFSYYIRVANSAVLHYLTVMSLVADVNTIWCAVVVNKKVLMI